MFNAYRIICPFFICIPVCSADQGVIHPEGSLREDAEVGRRGWPEGTRRTNTNRMRAQGHTRKEAGNGNTRNCEQLSWLLRIASFVMLKAARICICRQC